MDVRRGMIRRNLKKHIAVIVALVLTASIMIPVYSEPVDNVPENPGVENPEAQPGTEDPNAAPAADPNADPNAAPAADPNADPAALPQGDQAVSENADPGAGYELYDEFYDPSIYEDEEEDPYVGPSDETEARVSGSVSTGSLQRLIEEAQPGEETKIELNKDVSVSSQLVIEGGRNIVIDLKGNSLLSTGRGKSVRRAGIFGKYDMLVSGNGTVLNIEDSGSEKGRGRYCVSENNGIVVIGGAELKVSDAALEQCGDLYYIASAGNGGRISVSQGTVSGNLDNEQGGVISLTGGKYTVEPGSGFLAPGYGYVVNKKRSLYKYEVRKKIPVYINPEIEDGFVVNDLSLSECGIRKELYDENGERIKGTVITGGRFVETDENGGNPRTLSSSSVFEEAGSVHYMTVMNDSFPDEIEISDAADKNLLLTDVFDIKNGSAPDKDHLISFTVEDAEADSLSIALREGKKLCYGKVLEDPFEIFDVTYVYKNESTSLDKNSNVRFVFGYDEEKVKNGQGEGSYPHALAKPGDIIYVCAVYRGNRAYMPVTVQKQPVAIIGRDESTLVGEELSARYYQKISVYPVNEDGSVNESEPISVNEAISAWTDVASSAIDLTGISRDTAGTYENVALSEINALNSEKAGNYELVGSGYLKYTVEPSIILDFLLPGEAEPIADRRILEADSKNCIIGMFKNGKPSSDVRWMVMGSDGRMVDSSDAGITVKPANNGNGAVFSFDESIAQAGGGNYAIYEVNSRIRISGKISEDWQLSVDAISPVVFNGSKFVAEDDQRYFKKGTVKKGVSPVLDVKVFDGTKKLEIGKDYVLSYKYNKKANEPGSKKSPVVIITGKGDYAGAKIRAYFTIMPAE